MDAGINRPKPNIVYILADDMGYGDLSCYNKNSMIPTRYLDKLAAQGMRFTDAHAPASLCTPTRYGVLTGRYCWRSSLKNGVLWGYSPPLIEEGRMTVASLLRSAGYHTAAVGKWHLGWDWARRLPGSGGVAGAGGGAGSGAEKVMDPIADTGGDIDPRAGHEAIDFTRPIRNGPLAVGFDWFYGIPASLDMPPYCYVENDMVTAPVEEMVEESPWEAFWREGPIARSFRHVDVLPHLTEKAVAYIRERAREQTAAAGGGAGEAAGAQPFFLYFALPAPHTPVVPAPEYKNCSCAGDYGDFCVQVDDVVGQVLQAIEEGGIEQNTLVIFTSDNGPERTAYQRAQQYGHYSMGEWRGLKRDTWEGGHRVPFLAKWPGVIAPGSTSNQVICLTDLLATAAEIVGVKIPDNAGEDSLSILPAFAGKPLEATQRAAVIYQGASGTLAIRRGDWVYIDAPSGDENKEPEWLKEKRGYLPHNQPGELYRLSSDPTQARNLYKEQHGVVVSMKTLLNRYINEGRSVIR